MRVDSILKFCLITFLSLVCMNCGGSDGDKMNACGGNSTLTGEPGESCHRDGIWECDGPDALVCIDPYGNACGGCEILSHELLSPCGTCGVYICADDDESLVCEEQPPNACGGCTELANTWGGACNTCGTWACSDPNSLYCDEPVCLDCLDENFDISQVGVWRDRGDARSWPVVSDLTVTVEGSWLYFDFDQPETWIGDGITCSEFFVIYKDAGVWVAQVADYLSCDETEHRKYGFFDDWGPNNEWFRISSGDPVGFLVTSQSMSGGEHIPMYERTAVHMMCW